MAGISKLSSLLSLHLFVPLFFQFLWSNYPNICLQTLYSSYPPLRKYFKTKHFFILRKNWPWAQKWLTQVFKSMVVTYTIGKSKQRRYQKVRKNYLPHPFPALPKNWCWALKRPKVCVHLLWLCRILSESPWIGDFKKETLI